MSEYIVNKKSSKYYFIIFLISLFFGNFNIKTDLKAKENIVSEYLLGPTDILLINYKTAYFFSNEYMISVDGKLDLPEIGKINVEGLTINELEILLKEKYKSIIKSPNISISISKFRPFSIYISGEIKKPGLYNFNYMKLPKVENDQRLRLPQGSNALRELRVDNTFEKNFNQGLSGFKSQPIIIPKLFDALKRAGGVTNYADLSSIKIIRKNSNTYGGGNIETTINFMNLLSKGDQSQNIRIFDGDSIIIPKSDNPIKEQIMLATNSNLTSDQVTVFITGNVEQVGTAIIPRGASLHQAIASAGGKKSFTGKIEFIRFNQDGTTEKNIFKYKPNAKINSKSNPILMDGDVVYVRKTIFGKTSNFLKEISNPVITGYGLYEIFN